MSGVPASHAAARARIHVVRRRTCASSVTLRPKRSSPPTRASHTSGSSAALSAPSVPSKPTRRSCPRSRSIRASVAASGTDVVAQPASSSASARARSMRSNYTGASERRTPMGYETLLVDKRGAVATITLNRPEARNALDLVMRRELVAALDEIEADASARALIVTGAGGHFCAGGDVKSMQASRDAATAADGRARVVALNRLVQRPVGFPRPVSALVQS